MNQLAQREKRINDAIALRKPDRVPVWHGVPGPYPPERLGITREEQMMDIEKSLEANFQTALYYQSDMVELMPPIGATLAPAGYRHLKWAGHGLPAGSGWQFVDEELMKPEEYDELLREHAGAKGANRNLIKTIENIELHHTERISAI